GRKIDDEIEFGRLLDRDIGRLRPAQNLVNQVAATPPQVREVWSVGHHAARFDVLPKAVHRRQSRVQRQGADASSIGDNERVGTDIKRVHAALECLKGWPDILGSPYF